MSIAAYYQDGERKQDKGHFRNLVMIAKADGVISEKEDLLLKDIGSHLGLTNEELASIRKNPERYPISPPSDRFERFEQIVNLLQMVEADGVIDDAEMELLEKIAIGIGYKSLDDVDVESILALIIRGEDVEVIIEELL